MEYNQFILNLNHLKHNATFIKQNLKNNTKLCAMVKANAYGHLLKPVCEALFLIADFFGVSNIKEAQQIRAFDKITPILIVGLVQKKHLKWCSSHNVSITVDSLAKWNEVKSFSCITPLKIHFKINTGLNRYGFSNIDKFLKVYYEAQKNSTIQIEGIFTHFATSKTDEAFILKQHSLFKAYLNKIDTSSMLVHCCNSYAIERFNEFHYNMVRCGFDLFGYTSSNHLKPVLEIKSKIVALQKIKVGDTIGYERNFKAVKPMLIGVVPIGYGDGFDRRCSNRVSVVVNNKKAKVVGFVCMDAFMVNLTEHKSVKLLDEVIILGKTNDYNLSPQYYAKKLNTSPYEIYLKFQSSRMKVVLKK